MNLRRIVGSGREFFVSRVLQIAVTSGILLGVGDATHPVGHIVSMGHCLTTPGADDRIRSVGSALGSLRDAKGRSRCSRSQQDQGLQQIAEEGAC